MSALDKFSPKQTFFGGIAAALVAVCVIGFFILLAVVLKGGLPATATPVVVNNPPAGQPQPDTAEITLAAVSDRDHIRGAANAPISIVEYSDLECPFCKQFHPTMQQVVAEYDGRVNWVYRHFPLDSLHSKARKEAEASECAAELGGNDAFWEYVDLLFQRTPSNDGLDLALLPQFAKEIGLDEQQFTECLNSGRHGTRIQEDLDDAVRSGGRGTPYSVLVAGDIKIPLSGALPFAQVKSVIDSLLAQ